MMKRHDLTQGAIAGKLLMVAAPLMGTQLMQMFYNLTDMFWLGRVGSDAVASSGTAGMYLWLSTGAMFIGRMGAEIGVSQSLGRGDEEEARSFSRNSLLVASVLGVLFGLVMAIFHRPLIGFFNLQEAHVAHAAGNYLMITAFGILPTYLSATVTGTFNASGNSRTPFLINVIGLASNMILDPVLIFKFDMGVIGAAVATTSAQCTVALLSLTAVRWHRTRPLGHYSFRIRPDWSQIRQIFHWSTPIALETMLFAGLSMIISRFVSSFGAGPVAVQKIGTQVESLVWLIAGGFGSAMTAFVGQNFGAGKWFRIRKGVRFAMISMVVWSGAVALLLYFAGGALVSIFLSEPELVAIGATYLKIFAISEIPSALEAIAAGGFRGIGKTLPPSVASVSVNAARVVLAYVLSRTSLGLDGIWWGISIGASVRGLWIGIWFFIMMRRQPREDLVQQPVSGM